MRQKALFMIYANPTIFKKLVRSDRKKKSITKNIIKSIIFQKFLIFFHKKQYFFFCKTSRVEILTVFIHIFVGAKGLKEEADSMQLYPLLSHSRIEILRLVSVSTVEIEANVWRRLRECEKRVYKCSAFIVNSLLVIHGD